MSVFRNYNSQKAGGVNANAFPRVHPIPWIPSQRNVRTNPGIPSQPQRVQPQERGTFYPTSASNSGTLAPQMSSGCGGSCCGSSSAHVAPRTASQNFTEHAFPVSRIARPLSGLTQMQARTTGAIRGTPRSLVQTGIGSRRSPRLMSTSFMGGRGVR